MTGQRLSALLAKINITARYGPADPRITSLAYDSREVQEGSLFFALRGLHSDGHDYIAQAVSRGAAAIVCNELPPGVDTALNPEVSYIVVENSRTVMSPIACRFYDDPSAEMTIIGVTGTDGKSTTSYFIQQLLQKSGKKTGLLTTVQFDLGDTVTKNYLRQSTPEATEIHKLLREMRSNGCTHAVVEATSHGLSPINNRLGDVKFDVGVLTNISHEHLEFHKTLEQYIDDKANLFRALPPDSGTAVINRDEVNRQPFIDATACPVRTYSLSDSPADDRADLSVRDIVENTTSQEFTLVYADGASSMEASMEGHTRRVSLPQPGRFNIENTMAALLAVSGIPGENIDNYIPFIGELKPIRGRMVPVDEGQPFQVVVDYAHTPGSLEKLFPALRRQIPGKLIAVFGSAGERDVAKRSQLGTIASAYCDGIVLADEDPRGEEPREILEQIAVGCGRLLRDKQLFLIEDRPSAIRHAFSMARSEGDMVILLGKGHEGTIIYADGPIPWDEEEQARTILRQLGYHKRNRSN